jgi:tRNA pseudouridine38-40 synthase
MSDTLYKLVIAYDGTSFSGWQIQPRGDSIQGLLEKAFHTITKEECRVIGSGRTDAGVHALGQVAHVRLKQKREPHKIKHSLNGLLPPAIRVRSIEEAPKSFHAQLSAKIKEYHYHICLDEVVLPFDRPYVWHLRKTLDIPLLKKAAAHFVGTHDFAAFANAPGKTSKKPSTTRTISRLDVIETPQGIRLEFEGNGFLYKMVRNITGMLVAVASGRRHIADIHATLLSKDRKKAERAAPAQGLFLVRVSY